MLGQNNAGHLRDGAADGRKLGQKLLAVAAVTDHLFDALDLPFNAGQAAGDVGRMVAGMTFGHNGVSFLIPLGGICRRVATLLRPNPRLTTAPAAAG